jgi:hypothetical protein
MNLMRSLLSFSLMCGACYPAEQKQDNLPTAMSSAIDRVVKGNRADSPTPFFMAKEPKLRILELPATEVKFGLNQCSIPLTQAKVPDKEKFFIEKGTVPKNSPDSMPVLKAPVCPIAVVK